MTEIKRKTIKAITKQVKKLVKKHGPEKALGMATALVEDAVASMRKPDKKTTKPQSVTDVPKVAAKKPSRPATPKKAPRKAARKRPQAAASRKSSVATIKKPQPVTNEPLKAVISESLQTVALENSPDEATEGSRTDGE